MLIFSGFKNTFFLWLLLVAACGQLGKEVPPASPKSGQDGSTEPENPVIIAANRTAEYLPLLQGKKVAIVANQTSVIFKSPDGKGPGAKTDPPAFTHLVDSLTHLGIPIQKVFAPEHGFRGEADAGEKVKDGIDVRTGLPVISLYGQNRKPSEEHLRDIEVVLFDIQDVGVRFYTYIATLQLVMESCAAQGIPVVVLDRPNPNAHYVDGPTMEAEHTGFLGMTEIPLVYGMTIGEYARMINGEGWLGDGLKADLTVIPVKNYDHSTAYALPIRPSPNLPNARAINLYPSLGLFEGTNINAGRGTEFQFQRYGAPFLDSTQYSFSYVPQPNFGSKKPKHQGEVCFGKDLAEQPKLGEVSLQWLLDAYMNARDKQKVFNTDGFTKHAGTELLQQQIEAGLTEAEIKRTWQPSLEAFKAVRKKYLLYD